MEIFEHTSFLALLSTSIILGASVFLPFEFKSDDENKLNN